MPLQGELAALATALCWAGTSLFFSAAGRRVGALSVNQIRILMAVGLLVLAHLAAYGQPLPSLAGRWDSLGLLILSGLVGLLVGDSAYFRALVELGPKLAALLMSTYPIIGALLAWVLMGEVLRPLSVLGIAVALSGVGIAILGRPAAHRAEGNLRRGVALGLVGAAGQAAGILLSKGALNAPGVESGQGFDTLPGALIRMIAAMVALWGIALAQSWRARRAGQPSALRAAVRDRRAVALIFGGALVGPVIGVWLSLVAIVSTQVGIATTLMATVPIMVIPLQWLITRERPGAAEVAGAVVTTAGVAILLWA